MAHLYVESPDGQHRVELVPDDEEGLWDASCDRHPWFVLHGHSRLYLTDAHMEAAQHVDEHRI